MRIYNAELKFSVVREVAIETNHAQRPEQVVSYMQGAFDEHPEQETFWVLILNRKNRIKARHLVTVGLMDATLETSSELPSKITSLLGKPTVTRWDAAFTHSVHRASCNIICTTMKTSWRPPYWAEFCEFTRSAEYVRRVRALEAEGMTTSDAQGCADAEWREQWFLTHADK